MADTPYDQLSPAAKAVLDAGLPHAVHRFSIAAALEALADQAELAEIRMGSGMYESDNVLTRSKILAIAAELRHD